MGVVKGVAYSLIGQKDSRRKHHEGLWGAAAGVAMGTGAPPSCGAEKNLLPQTAPSGGCSRNSP